MVKRGTCCMVLLLCLGAPSATAGSISATSTATLVTTGPYQGWYRYDIDVVWTGFSHGLSHCDLILKDGCAEADHLYGFDDPAGYSNSESNPGNPMAVAYLGLYEPGGDPSIPVPHPVTKWEVKPGQTEEPGRDGEGTFWFYCNVLPEYVDPAGAGAGKMAAKAGQTVEWGDLEGDWPSCTIVEPIPEPVTLALLGLSACGLGGYVRRRRKG